MDASLRGRIQHESDKSQASTSRRRSVGPEPGWRVRQCSFKTSGTSGDLRLPVKICTRTRGWFPQEAEAQA